MAGSVSRYGDKYPEELRNAGELAALRLVELGIEAADAERIGWELAEHLRTFWGGRQKYILHPRQSDQGQGGLFDSANHGDGLTGQEMLVDIAEQVEERLLALGYANDEASSMGWDVTRRLNDHWGGGLLYICKGLHYEIERRDLEIYSRFNGDNHEWLASEYNLTVQHIYRIVKRVGAIERAKRQASLPGLTS